MKKNVIIADTTNALELTIWESHFDQIVLGDSYHIRLLKIRIFNDQISLTATADTSFIKIEDLQETVNEVDNNINRCHTLQGKIISIEKNKDQFACQGCGGFNMIETANIITCNDCHSRLFKDTIAGESVPKVACYDDGYHLVKYIQNHVGDRIVDSLYARQLKNIKFSIDKAHWRNHVDLDNCNTQVAEQLFSWLKRYAPIISSLGWLRAPVYLLPLFHYKNLETTHTRSTHHFDIADLVPDVPHASLAHAGNNQFLTTTSDLIIQQHTDTSMHASSSNNSANKKKCSTRLEISSLNNNSNKWIIEANKIYTKRGPDAICLTTESLIKRKRIHTRTHTPSTDLNQTSFNTSKWSKMRSEIRKNSELKEKNDARSKKRQEKHISH
ncbi:unnamed protein product [Adineta steineri]|uniref:Uncharacterized protein n=1 Tax=Adineta steineri TaxID=433720 RepID=A0A819R7H0_9BILA|nr:unnamed protein product [Adineta steineri]